MAWREEAEHAKVVLEAVSDDHVTLDELAHLVEGEGGARWWVGSWEAARGGLEILEVVAGEQVDEVREAEGEGEGRLVGDDVGGALG